MYASLHFSIDSQGHVVAVAVCLSSVPYWPLVATGKAALALLGLTLKVSGTSATLSVHSLFCAFQFNCNVIWIGSFWLYTSGYSHHSQDLEDFWHYSPKLVTLGLLCLVALNPARC